MSELGLATCALPGLRCGLISEALQLLLRVPRFALQARAASLSKTLLAVSELVPATCALLGPLCRLLLCEALQLLLGVP